MWMVIPNRTSGWKERDGINLIPSTKDGGIYIILWAWFVESGIGGLAIIDGTINSKYILKNPKEK